MDNMFIRMSLNADILNIISLKNSGERKEVISSIIDDRFRVANELETIVLQYKNKLRSIK